MMPMTPALELALAMADEARKIALAGFRSTQRVKNKASSGFDPTTESDIAIEQMMQRRISAAFPDHAVQGEELPPLNPDASTRWIIDPIDGTRNYYAGSLFWGVLIALSQQDELQFGIIDHPPTKERFVADKNSGWWSSDSQTKQLKTTSTTTLKEAVLASTTPQMFQDNTLSLFNAVSAQAAITLYGGNCYFYGLLALGHLDCVIEADLQVYDIAALVPIVRAAGGVISNWQGADPLSGSGQIVASATPQLHDIVLRHLNP